MGSERKKEENWEKEKREMNKRIKRGISRKTQAA